MADIHSLLAKVAGEIGSINKTERNKEQGFNFRSIEQITGAVRPLFAKAGISVAPKMLSIEHHEVTSAKGSRGFRAIVVMQYTFSVGDSTDTVASSVETSMVGEAVDYGDKSTSKAAQMAYKYALTQVLQIGSGDDPDSHSVDLGNAEGYTPRPRSGGRRGPTPPPESQESPPVAPGNGVPVEVAAAVAKLKTDLLNRVGGDKNKAVSIWRDVLVSYGVPPDQAPSLEMLEGIEADLRGPHEAFQQDSMAPD